MQSKLILVEGIPGSGKSTIAKKIHACFRENGFNSRLYNEGDLNPADLAWHACLPVAEFNHLLNEYPLEKDAILTQTVFENDYAMIAYTKIQTENKDLYPLFARYEVFDNRVPFELYRDLHFRRWSDFGKKATKEDMIYILECAYLQNHVTELLLFREKDEDAIQSYMGELLSKVQSLNPLIIYLSQPDVRETMEWISNVRTNENGEKDWLNEVVRYVRNSPYGKRHNLKDFDGLAAIMEKRKAIELELLKRLNASVSIIDNGDRDWNLIWQEVKVIIR